MPLANLVYRGYSNSLSPYWLRLECVSVSSASIVWPEQARGAWQGQEHSLFELLNGYKVLVKCSKNGKERTCRSRGLDRGQTGLLLAALLTPIKTGRHFIALAYQISWHSGINKGSNKYDLLTSPRPPREQKSLLLINLGPSPSPTPAGEGGILLPATLLSSLEVSAVL